MQAGVFAAIFDLDGVLTSTSVRHEQSWADAAAHFGIPVSEAALHATRSIPRASALNALLAHAGATMPASDCEALMAFKNERYHQLIEGLQPADAFPGAHAALARCRGLGLRIGIASASMNAALVLERIGLRSLVDFVADPGKAAPKPSSEIYTLARTALSAQPGYTICIEDGAPMIANLRAANLYTIGIGESPLGADEQYAGVAEWNPETTLSRLWGRQR
jgi:HAD superfamily hydrolase (TIGR01509 family)